MLGGEMVVKWDFTHDVHATCRAHTELVELGVVLADGFRTCGLIIARVAVLVRGQVQLEVVGALEYVLAYTTADTDVLGGFVIVGGRGDQRVVVVIVVDHADTHLDLVEAFADVLECMMALDEVVVYLRLLAGQEHHLISELVHLIREHLDHLVQLHDRVFQALGVVEVH